MMMSVGRVRDIIRRESNGTRAVYCAVRFEDNPSVFQLVCSFVCICMMCRGFDRKLA